MQTRRWWTKSYKKVSFMDAGIKIKDVVVGTGDIAQRDKIVVVHARALLCRGDEVWESN
jgi:FKBP-type peptidyl-prolyl cis-trans isomerase